MRDDGDDRAAQFRLRVTTGPMAGARFELTGPVTIGRSSRAQVFICDPGVSRRHAKVLPTGRGHTLVDLDSANGTLIEGATIDERALTSGTSFVIGATTFVYERITLRRPTPAGPGTYVMRGGASGRHVERFVAVGAPPQPAEPPMARVEAHAPDGSPYPGDLVGDVILHRNLRLRLLRQHTVAPSVQRRFESLDERLRTRAETSTRARCARVFTRFTCSIPARLRCSQDDTDGCAAQVIDLSAGGARLRSTNPLQLDDLCWVLVELVTASGPNTIAFTSRVVWKRGDEMGVVFSGAPGWSRHAGPSEGADTQPRMPDRGTGPRAVLRPVKLRLAGSDGDED